MAARVHQVVKTGWARAACSRPALTGISRPHLGALTGELSPKWQAARESALLRVLDRRGLATGGAVQDELDVQPGRDVLVDRLEERQEFLGAVALMRRRGPVPALT
jgi:hypothetical protein